MAELLYHSYRESETLGLKVARGGHVFESLENGKLWNEIKTNRFDICRMKVNLGDINLFHALDDFPCPVRIYTLNYHNVKIIPSSPEPLPQNLSWQTFTQEMKKELLSCLDVLFVSRSWPEYNQGEFSTLFPPGSEKKLFIRHFSEFHQEENQDARTFFLRWKNEIVGIFMGTIIGEAFHGSLYGILPEYRGRGFSKIIYSAMDWICKELGLKFFKNEIHIQNLPSLKSAESGGLIPKQMQANISMYPLLSKTSGQDFSFRWSGHQNTDLIQCALSEINTRFPQFHIRRINSGNSEYMKGEKACTIHFPLITNTSMIAICNPEGNEFLYFEFTR